MTKRYKNLLKMKRSEIKRAWKLHENKPKTKYALSKYSHYNTIAEQEYKKNKFSNLYFKNSKLRSKWFNKMLNSFGVR